MSQYLCRQCKFLCFSRKQYTQFLVDILSFKQSYITCFMCVFWKPSHLLMNCTAYLMETRSISRRFWVFVYVFSPVIEKLYVNCANFIAVFMLQCERFTCFDEVLQPFEMQWIWNGIACGNISTAKYLKLILRSILAILILSLFHWANKSFGMKMWFYLSASSTDIRFFFLFKPDQ